MSRDEKLVLKIKVDLALKYYYAHCTNGKTEIS